MNNKEEGQISIRSAAQTLLIAGIVATVTTIGTVRVVAEKLDRMERTIDKLVERLDAVALKQAHVIGQADQIHKHLHERIDAIEKRR